MYLMSIQKKCLPTSSGINEYDGSIRNMSYLQCNALVQFTCIPFIHAKSTSTCFVIQKMEKKMNLKIMIILKPPLILQFISLAMELIELLSRDSEQGKDPFSAIII